MSVQTMNLNFYCLIISRSSDVSKFEMNKVYMNEIQQLNKQPFYVIGGLFPIIAAQASEASDL